MDVTVSFTAIGLYGLLFLLFPVESVVFELNDYDLNRVVYVLESNITMTCDASEVADPQIVILHDGVNVVQINNSFVLNEIGNTLELTITRINLRHNGAYQCTVTSEQGAVEVSELMLNVTSSGRHCLQSESSLVKMESEYFTLYCYFLWFAQQGDVSAFDNTWDVTDGVVSSSLTGPSDVSVSSGNVKGIIVFHIGPLELSDNGKTYICDHPQPTGSPPCDIGPIIVQPNRSIADSTTIPYNSAPTTITAKRTSFITSTDNVTMQGTATQSTEQPTPPNSGLPSSSTEENGTPSTSPDIQRTSSPGITELPNVPSNLLFILIVSVSATIAVGVFLIIIICLVLSCCKRSENKESEIPTARIDYDLTENPVYGSGNDDDNGSMTQPVPFDREKDSGDVRTTSFQSSVNQRDRSPVAATNRHHFGRESDLGDRKYDVPRQGLKEAQGRVPAPRGTGGDDHHGYVNASRQLNPTGEPTNGAITNREETSKSGAYDDPPKTVDSRDEAAFILYDNNLDIARIEGAPRRSDEEEAEGDFDYLYGVVKKKRTTHSEDTDEESGALY